MDLTDAQWAALEPPFRPKRRDDGRGRPWQDTRAVLNGVFWVLRTGAPWHDLPRRYLREMCPHVFGSKDGVRHVLSFQFAGDSSQGFPAGGQWKCMDVDGMSNVSLREGLWFTGPGKTGNPQPCVDIAHISVTL